MAEDTEDKEELSMEDILSSIKDILMEDNAEQHKAAQKEEPAPQAAAPQPAPEVSRPAPVETVDDVLTLSPSMIVEPNISTVEAQPEAFYPGVGLGEREIVVERQRQEVLHPETHRQLEPVVFRAERDALADLDVGHVAQLLDQFVGRIGRNDFGPGLGGSGLRLPGCGQRPAGGEQEQDR